MYLAILFALDADGSQSIVCSCTCENVDKNEIIDLLTGEADVSVDEVDTILVVQSTEGYKNEPRLVAPTIVKQWSASNGDF